MLKMPPRSAARPVFAAGLRVWESVNLPVGGSRAVWARKRAVFAASWRGEGRALASLAAGKPAASSRVPPPAVDDLELRPITGTMQIPELLRQRALSALRLEGGKQRVGLQKMVTRSRSVSPPTLHGERSAPWHCPHGDARGAHL